jgi:hypothetical protein
MAKGALKRVYFDITEDGTFGLMPEAGPENVPFQAFPCVRYHASEEPKWIKNKSQLDKLTKDWSAVPIRPQDCDRREPIEE